MYKNTDTTANPNYTAGATWYLGGNPSLVRLQQTHVFIITKTLSGYADVNP